MVRPASALALAHALVLSCLAASASLAQDAPPTPTSDDPAGGAAPAAPVAAAEPAAAAEIADRIGALYERVAQEPPNVIASEPDKDELARIAAQRAAWEADVDALCKAGDAYTKALAGAPGRPRLSWWTGYARARHAERVGRDEALQDRTVAADLFRRALDGAQKEADYRADAEYWLGRMQIFLAEAGRDTLPEAIEHLRSAALAFRKAARNDDSGRAATAALKSLVTKGMTAEARDFATAIDAGRADFGVLTEKVRVLARRARTSPGDLFPDLADAAGADGKPVKWKELRGAPFIVHFFHAGWPTGRASGERDVETVLRPLWDRLQTRGLRMVGVSMDFALSKERVEEITRNWDEWGVKDRLQDGSRASVQRWTEDQGVAWPWIWDGLWEKSPVSQALGGPGVNAAHAVLVDAEGVVRWRGDAPFTGLAEAVDKAVESAPPKK